MGWYTLNRPRVVHYEPTADKGGSGYANVKSNYYGAGESRHTSATNKTSYFYSFDHLGSIREVTNNSGAIQAAYDYTPFGVRTFEMGADTWKSELETKVNFNRTLRGPAGPRDAWQNSWDERTRFHFL